MQTSMCNESIRAAFSDVANSVADKYSRIESTFMNHLLQLHFPSFGPFIVAAEDLLMVFSKKDDLLLHWPLKEDHVSSINDHLSHEIEKGARDALRFLKRLVAAASPATKPIETHFFDTFISVIWCKFKSLMQQKLIVFKSLVSRCFSSVVLQINQSDVNTFFRA